jgi:hypothetical protein
MVVEMVVGKRGEERDVCRASVFVFVVRNDDRRPARRTTIPTIHTRNIHTRNINTNRPTQHHLNIKQARSDEASPLLHVGLDPSLGLSVAAQKKVLRAASRKCVDAGYAICTYEHLSVWMVGGI